MFVIRDKACRPNNSSPRRGGRLLIVLIIRIASECILNFPFWYRLLKIWELSICRDLLQGSKQRNKIVQNRP